MESMNEESTSRPRPAYHHGDLRAALVEATRRLVEEKGPDHFSVAEAARAAGVSTAAPYRHFKDKDELLAAVCLDAMARHHRQMVEALEQVRPRTIDRIKCLGRVYIAYAQAEPGMFRLSFGSKQNPLALEALKERDGDPDTFGLVVAEVADVLGRRPDSPEATRRAFILWTFVHGLSFLLIDDKVRYAGIDIDVEGLLDEVAVRVMTEPASRS